MRIGIYGGSFDPIHNGHLMLGQYAMHELQLDRLMFVPTGTPPEWYKGKLSSREHRLNMIYKTMCNLFSSVEFNYMLNLYEINKKGVCYTIDFIRHIKKHYKTDLLFLICGPDVADNIHKWKDYNELKELVHIRIAGKDFYCPDFHIRSSNIKELVRLNKPITFFVNEKVEKYIKENNLYKEKK